MIQPTRRLHDRHLMDIAVDNNYRKETLEQIDAFRLYLQVTTISEITTADGTTLLQSAWDGEGTASKSAILWPVQEKPGQTALTQWRKLLRSLCTQQWKSRQLRESLGHWQDISHRTWQTYYDVDTHRIYDQEPGTWRIYKIRKHRLFWTATATPQTIDLPFNSQLIPIDLQDQIIPPEIERPRVPVTIGTSWQSYIWSLPEWQQDLLRFTTNEYRYNNGEILLRTILHTSKQLYLVTDGGGAGTISGKFWLGHCDRRTSTMGRLWIRTGIPYQLPPGRSLREADWYAVSIKILSIHRMSTEHHRIINILR